MKRSHQITPNQIIQITSNQSSNINQTIQKTKHPHPQLPYQALLGLICILKNSAKLHGHLALLGDMSELRAPDGPSNARDQFCRMDRPAESNRDDEKVQKWTELLQARPPKAGSISAI